MLKKFVCLAKSEREGGLCIAGKEILDNGEISKWFRPIGKDREALAREDCTFGIGDVVTCEVSHHEPNPPQHENHIVPDRPNWQTLHKFPKEKFFSLVDSPSLLWSAGAGCSTYHGKNDKVAEQVVLSATNSLYFIQIDGGEIIKKDEGYAGKERPRIRLNFSYRGNDYSLAVTHRDFSYEYFVSMNIGDKVPIGKCFITVSLAKPWNNYCYKVVAGHVII